MGVGRATDFVGVGRAFFAPGINRGRAHPRNPGQSAVPPGPIDVHGSDITHMSACGGSELFSDSCPAPNVHPYKFIF